MARRISTVIAELEAQGVTTDVAQLARILENPKLKPGSTTTMSTPHFADSIVEDNAKEAAKSVAETAESTSSDEPSEPAAPSGDAASATTEEGTMNESKYVTIGKLDDLPLVETLTPATARDLLFKLLGLRRFAGIDSGRYVPDANEPEDGLEHRGATYVYNSIVEGDLQVRPSAVSLNRLNDNDSDWPFISMRLGNYICEVIEVITRVPQQHWAVRKMMRGDISPRSLAPDVQKPVSSGRRRQAEPVDHSIDPIEIQQEKERSANRKKAEQLHALENTVLQLITDEGYTSLDKLEGMMSELIARHPDANDDDIMAIVITMQDLFEEEA